MATSFNALKYAQALKKAGMDPAMAEAQAEALSDAIQQSELATKADLKELEYKLTLRIIQAQIAGTVTAITVMLAAMRYMYLALQGG